MESGVRISVRVLVPLLLLLAPSIGSAQPSAYVKRVQIADSAAKHALVFANLVMTISMQGETDNEVKLGSLLWGARDEVNRLTRKFTSRPAPSGLSPVHGQMITALNKAAAYADTSGFEIMFIGCVVEIQTQRPCNRAKRGAAGWVSWGKHLTLIVEAVKEYNESRQYLTEQLLERGIKLPSAK